jgi:hypothetical protein
LIDTIAMIGSPAARGAVASVGRAGRACRAAAASAGGAATTAAIAIMLASVTMAAGAQRRDALACAYKPASRMGRADVNRYVMPFLG